VNPEPLGRCPFGEECSVVESPTQFVCERKLKEAENGGAAEAAKSCGFVFPRTVCKREISREEAEVYLAKGRTELLTEFTSRYGRPFSATLVLKKNGRHGFEFPPRQGRAARAPEAAGEGAGEDAARATTPRKRAGSRKAAGAGKKTSRKKAGAARSPKARARKPASS
jgi:DNA topoisomerase-3